MQAKSAEKCSIPKRLEALRLSKQLTWDGMADLLEISPSMVYQVRRGARSLGDLVMHRLEQAEVGEGLLSSNKAAWARLLRDPETAKVYGDVTDTPIDESSHGAYIKMRLEVLADIIETYDSEEMEILCSQLKPLITSDKKFGKVFDQLSQVVAHLQMRKERREELETPRKTRKKK